MSDAHARDLACLFHRYECDKGWLHRYEDEYARHFGPLRQEAIRLLEIGVGGYGHPDCGGEGLKCWRDYFPNAAIVGIDVAEKALDLGERVTVLQCDAASPDELRAMHEHWGPFDVVIDDGSHEREHIVAAFRTLFPALKAGGIYAVEDLDAAFSRPARRTGLSFLGWLADGQAVASIHLAGQLGIIRKA